MALVNNVDDAISTIKKFTSDEAKEFREKIVHDAENFDVFQIVSTGIKPETYEKKQKKVKLTKKKPTL